MLATRSAPVLPTAGDMLALRVHNAPDATWTMKAVAGRFVALEPSQRSGTGALSLLAELIRDAQTRQGQAAWISLPETCFFPPDFAAAGVDLAALPIVRAPDVMKAARAADTLIRSGSFSLIVIDGNVQALPLAMQTRLSGLAHQFNTALVVVRSPGEEKPKGSLVSLRCATGTRRIGPGTFECELRAVKDKRLSAGWGHKNYRMGPDGLF